MNIRLFYHSLVSDWNHGNAHFLRGILAELKFRGHRVRVFEPAGGWSRTNLEREHGAAPLARFHAAYPGLQSTEYTLEAIDLEAELAGADLVIVHEWNDPRLVRRIGEVRRRGSFVLLYHDTHHALVSDPARITAALLRDYDGVLAYGQPLRDLYLRRRLVDRAWTWHEAADTRVFRPLARADNEGDLVWIGNWGDGERTEELREFLVEPIRELGLRARFHGVRYPPEALRLLESAGIEYAGWLPNFDVPEVFSRFKITAHVPRRPYVEALPGIPTIRPFEAMACGIPLVTSPWSDAEKLFAAGRDYLVARDGPEMRRHLRALLDAPPLRQALAAHAFDTIRSRHTCVHRVEELLSITGALRAAQATRRLLACSAPAVWSARTAAAAP